MTKHHKPGDAKVCALAQHLAEATAIGGYSPGGIHLIDKDYQIITIGESERDSATRQRQRLLMSGRLLAVVMTGWALGDEGQVVCQYYPAPGQVENYILNYPRPEVTWGDPNYHESLTAFGAYGEIWRIGDLEDMDPYARQLKDEEREFMRRLEAGEFESYLREGKAIPAHVVRGEEAPPE